MSALERMEPPEVISGQLIEGMDEEEYHAHHALSTSGMKQLLRSPKHFQLSREEERAPKPAFDEGHAIHERVLGVGAPIVQIPRDLLSADGGVRTKDAKAWVDKARDEGKVPLKPPVYYRITRAADAVLSNAKAKSLLDRPGLSEVSLFAQDPVTGVQLRCRFDRLSDIGLDVKSTTDVRPRKVTSTVIDFGYDVQAWVYRYVYQLVTGEELPPMHFIFVEKEPPYEVRVVRLADPAWAVGGEAKARAAIDLFAWCMEHDRWPGDDEDGGPIQDLPVPAWYERQMDALTEDAL
ncbi:PD-(D/E)XK nuclease-like domain-containing protein [Microbacterium sp. NPDC089696]|uniref:PD-(D/E)XK nuclease-like domain-containing protein n=1 Tax=Microbacterium sp. NPDC089696 TaxID=3364199 RepID=UPI003829A1E3